MLTEKTLKKWRTIALFKNLEDPGDLNASKIIKLTHELLDLKLMTNAQKPKPSFEKINLSIGM